jgi:hypothetical protein
MFRLILALAVILLFTAPVHAELKMHGFFGLSWGASKKQVVLEFQAKPVADNKLMTRHTRDSKDSHFIFEFEKDKLIRVVTRTKDTLISTPLEAAKLCDLVANNMSELNGEAEVYKDPMIGPILLWQNNDTEAWLACDLDNNSVVTIWQLSEKSKTTDKKPPIKINL